MLFAIAFGALYAPLVMTGLHHMTNAIDTQLTTSYNGTPLWPMIALSNIAQGSAVLAMSFLQKKNDRAQQINVPACISCYLGVTEPALFGVNLKYKFPLVCGMIGSATAAAISVGFGVEATSIGVGGLPGILSIKPQFWGVFLLAMLVAIVIPFVLTMIVGKAKLSAEERYGAKAAAAVTSGDAAAAGAADVHTAGAAVATATVAQPAAADAPVAPANTPSTPSSSASGSPADASITVADGENMATAILDGTVIPLEQVPDEVFSQKIVGDGVAFEPTSTVVRAPADAEVTVVMADTGHACGLTLANGVELLIHVGVDTVAMGGDGFRLFVSGGDHVRRGDPLIEFDPDKIKAAGHPTTTMLIVTGQGGATDMTMHTGMPSQAGTTPVITW